MRIFGIRLAVTVAAALTIAVAVGAASEAGAANAKRKKTVTYLVTLKVDGRTVVGPFASTETVTGEVLANPFGAAGAGEPTAWEAEGPLDFGPILKQVIVAAASGAILTVIVAAVKKARRHRNR